jgi:uncharacterized protein (DUF58 family)
VTIPVETSGSAKLAPLHDGRFESYAIVAVVGFGGALVTGQPILAALAFPFALALALGLRQRGSTEVRAKIILDAGQVLEGDPVTGRIILEWDRDARGDVMLHRLEGVEPLDRDAVRWSLPTTVRGMAVPVQLRATQWGRHTMCEVWVRLTDQFGLVTWTGKVVPPPALRILPGTERLNRLLPPTDPRAVWGMHASRRLGHGVDFAELRPYAPGDRLRDMNWTATARRGSPFVNRYHPESAGEMAVVLDAFGDGSRNSTRALVRAARVAWALISAHLDANDRVGLAGIGGSTQWLPPGGGRLARYRLLETLLRIGGEAAAGRTLKSGFLRVPLPPSSLVVALSPLEDQASLDALVAWRARGRSVVVALIDKSELPGVEGEALQVAARWWRLQIASRRRLLEKVGIPVVDVPADASVDGIIRMLHRTRRNRTAGRSR